MTQMGRLEFGRLREAWKGEASDFTPLLAEQLDQIGAAIGVDLAAVGRTEVATDGGRWIDILAEGSDGTEFVIENQYGRADHDHLTRGLAYAVARRARGLVVVAEEHRDEFRAVATYLNDLAESDTERGIAVWLVEARAVRVDNSVWAPIFSAVISPNAFTASVAVEPGPQRLRSMDDFAAHCKSAATANAVGAVVQRWIQSGRRRYFGVDKVVLEARGPSAKGDLSIRAVATVYLDGSVMIPVDAYNGVNSSRIDVLVTPPALARIDDLFGVDVGSRRFRTTPGWLDSSRIEDMLAFCNDVAAAYGDALAGGQSG